MMPEFVNSEQWVRMYNEACGTNCYTPNMLDMYRNGTDPDLYPNADWIDALYRNVTYNQRVNASIVGGDEVALKQFWIQKSFMPQFNLRMGHIVVPVGATNANHMPTELFGAYQPEGENTILPCTWHKTGISLWGVAGKWHYEVMFLPGLNSVSATTGFISV